MSANLMTRKWLDLVTGLSSITVGLSYQTVNTRTPTSQLIFGLITDWIIG